MGEELALQKVSPRRRVLQIRVVEAALAWQWARKHDSLLGAIGDYFDVRRAEDAFWAAVDKLEEETG